MPTVPAGSVQKTQLAAAIRDLERTLKADVVRIRHSLGNDWAGEPAMFFRVVLTDEASKPDRLHDVTSRVIELIWGKLDPLRSWGLFPYVNFRSESEQVVLREEAWEA